MKLRKLIRLQFAIVAIVVGLGITAIVNASRNSSGTYSLPTGNPVTTGTAISSTVHNNTMSDIATELTDSLSRSNKGPMLAPLELMSGADSCASPALTWDGDENLGVMRSGADTMEFCAAGTSRGTVVSTGMTLSYGLVVTEADSNTSAVNATGNGSGHGIIAVGGSSGYGGHFSNATAATGGTRKDAVLLANGDLSLSGVTYPDSTTGVSNRLTPSNVPKLWTNVTITNATPFVPSVTTGFNVASVSRVDSTTMRVTIADDMANANYAVIYTGTGGDFARVFNRQVGSFDVEFYNDAGSRALDGYGAHSFFFVVFGAQ